MKEEENKTNQQKKKTEQYFLTVAKVSIQFSKLE